MEVSFLTRQEALSAPRPVPQREALATAGAAAATQVQMGTERNGTSMLTQIIVWIVIGGLAGWLASLLVQGTGLGLLGDIIVGIVGALIGGFILSLFGLGTGGLVWTFITAFIGAVILLYLVRLIGGGRIRGRGRV
jgi:uncharacterized membrane protein YeaQ/YmgE (transglycosylase-associated protein family)